MNEKENEQDSLEAVLDLLKSLQDLTESIQDLQSLLDNVVDRCIDYKKITINNKKQEHFHRLCILAKLYEVRYRRRHSDLIYVSIYPPSQTVPFGAVSIDQHCSNKADLDFCTLEDMNLLKGMLEDADRVFFDSETTDEKSKPKEASLLFVVDGIVENLK